MSDQLPPDQPLAPGERIEQHVVTERVSPGTAGVASRVESAPARRAAPMWAWLLPLVILVLVLAWYIFTRGQPDAPLGFNGHTPVELLVGAG